MCNSLVHIHWHNDLYNVSWISEKGPHPTYHKPVIREQGTLLDTRDVQFASNNSQGLNTNKHKRTV